MSYINLNPTIFEGSDCDYKLVPSDWADNPITVYENWISDATVAQLRATTEANLQHGICNLGYTRDGGGVYMPQFRRSADINASFYPATVWQDITRAMLRAAIDRYGAIYGPDTPEVQSGSHSFTTVYKKEAAVLGLHSDGGTQVNGVWRASVTTRYEMSGLLYLTTAGVDFDGGALVFPYLAETNGNAITYYPRAGDLVVFPANPLFSHRVDRSNGERIVMGAWRAWRPYSFARQGR